MSTTMVDWHAYATKYDLLLEYNPYYQEVFQRIHTILQKWEMNEGAKLADIGAGTGNYSVVMAELFPNSQILHIDNNKGMNARAAEKAKGLSNFEILNQSIEEVELAPNSLQGLLCINAIYTFPEPKQLLQRMYEWMEPGAKAILVDPGRIMNLFSWRLAIASHLVRNYGLRKTFKIFHEAKSVSKQNAYIRSMQQNGTYWTHTNDEFCGAVEQAGFEIEVSDTCFRGDCDFVVAVKH